MVGTQKKLSGFGSISSIGSLSVCGKFAASVFPTFVKKYIEVVCYVCVVSAGYTVRCNKCIRDCSFLFLFFRISLIVSHVFFPLFLCMSNFSLK